MPLTIWTNTLFNEAAMRLLTTGIKDRGHRLVVSPHTSASVLVAGKPDPAWRRPTSRSASRMPRSA